MSLINSKLFLDQVSEILTMTMFVSSSGYYHGTEFDHISGMVAIMNHELILSQVELELGNQPGNN